MELLGRQTAYPAVALFLSRSSASRAVAQTTASSLHISLVAATALPSAGAKRRRDTSSPFLNCFVRSNERVSPPCWMSVR